MNQRYYVCMMILTLALMPVLANASPRLVNVTAVSGGCLSGPTGVAVQAWDIEPGETYTVTIADVVECAAGGTGPTIDVRIENEDLGYQDLIATLVAPGVYAFDWTMPLEAFCTYEIRTCTTPGDVLSGDKVIRADGINFQTHLRAATFQAGCTNPTTILGGLCAPIPTDDLSWGTMKAQYN